MNGLNLNQLPSLKMLVIKIWRSNCIALIFSLFAFHTAQGQQIYINEFMASNGTTISYEIGDFDDWVELYNPGSTAIDIGGMYLSDDPIDPLVWQIPTTDPASTTIPAGGFLLLWLDKETTQGPLHIDVKLGSGGEDIILTAANGTTTIDSYTFGTQLEDVSEGRLGDGNAGYFLCHNQHIIYFFIPSILKCKVA